MFLQNRRRAERAAATWGVVDITMAKTADGLGAPTPQWPVSVTIDPTKTTAGDLARSGVAVESAHGLISKDMGLISRLLHRAGRHHQVGVLAQGRADTHGRTPPRRRTGRSPSTTRA